MIKVKQLGLAFALLISVSLYPVLAQTAPGSPSGPTFRKEACWEQAGISKSVMPQIRQIHQSTRSQVESVCSNSSLTPQQKQQEIQQLHQQAQQQIEALVGSQQLQALRSCQQQSGGMGNGMHHSGNPCGNISANPGQQPAPPHP